MHRLPKLAFPRRLGAATFTAKTPGDFTRRTSIQFSVCNEAGGLLTPLSIFKEHNISLLQLQPRSVALNESSKAITMYCDFEGHTDDAHVQQCLAQLREITLFMTVCFFGGGSEGLECQVAALHPLVRSGQRTKLLHNYMSTQPYDLQAQPRPVFAGSLLCNEMARDIPADLLGFARDIRRGLTRSILGPAPTCACTCDSV